MKTNEINPSDNNNEIRDDSSKGLEIKTTGEEKFIDEKEPNKFEDVEKEKLSKDSEVGTKWENNNEQFRHFENTSNQEPYNKTEEFRKEANSYAEKLREDREEQQIKLNELREEQERLKKQLDEMAEERNLSACNYMNDKELCQVLDDHTAVSEDIEETELDSKLTESNIERAEELSGKERIEKAEEKKENKGDLEATEREEDSNSEAGEEQKYKNKFYEVEKDKLPEDFELETKWENNNEQFRHFENTSNQEPYNKTEGFREEANSYAEKLREDREEQQIKLNELQEEQERLKKQLDEMVEERNLSASNYMNDKEFCQVLDDHTAVSEDIKETEMASKVTESNIERAEELSGKERIEEEKTQKDNKKNLEGAEREIENHPEVGKEKNVFNEVEKDRSPKNSEQLRNFESKANQGMELNVLKESQNISKMTESNTKQVETVSEEKELKGEKRSEENKSDIEVSRRKDEKNNKVENENKFDRVEKDNLSKKSLIDEDFEKETSISIEKSTEMVNKMKSTIYKDMLKMREVDEKVLFLQDQKLEVLEKQVLQQITDYQKTSEKIINEYDNHVDKHKIERLIDENAEKLVRLKSLNAEIDTYRNSIYDNIIKEYGVDISSYQNDILRYKALTNLMVKMDYVLGHADTMDYTLLAEIGRDERYIDEYSKSNIETVDKLMSKTENELQRIETNPELILEPTEVIKIENMLKRLDLFTKELLEIERQDKQLDIKILDKIMEETGLKIEDTDDFIDLKNEQIVRIEVIENRIDQVSKTLRDKYKNQGISKINRNADGTYSITYTDNKSLKKHENGEDKKIWIGNDKRQTTYVMGKKSEQLYAKENAGELSLLTFYRSKLIGTIQTLFKTESGVKLAELNVRREEKTDYERNVERNTDYQFTFFGAEKERTHFEDDKKIESTKADIEIGKIEVNKNINRDGSANIKATTNIAAATLKEKDERTGFYGKGNVTVGAKTIEAKKTEGFLYIAGITGKSDDLNVGVEVGQGNEKIIRSEINMNRKIVNVSGSTLADKIVNPDTKLYQSESGVHFSSIVGNKGRFAQSKDGERWELLKNLKIDNLLKMKEDAKTVKSKIEKKKGKDEL